MSRAGLGTPRLAPRDSAPSGDARAPPLVLRRPRRLPAGRALTGALLVAVATVGIVAAYADATAGPTHSYVVARRDLDAGALLQPGDVSLAAADLPTRMRRSAFDDPRAVVGMRLLGALSEGELVQRSAVAPAGAERGAHELSFPVERAHALDGRLIRGERVDVLATYGTGADAVTVAVVRAARVVAVDDARGSLGEQSSIVVTLAVTRPEDVAALAHAVQAGAVTIVRASGGQSSDGLDSYRAPVPGEPS